MTLNRRDWLKLTAGAGAAAGLAVAELRLNVQEAQAATKKEAKLSGTRQVTTACNFCSCGCA